MNHKEEPDQYTCRLRFALVLATSWLTGGATAGFESTGLSACPTVVDYSREFQAQVAKELALLPDGSAVVEMMGDYAVMRGQARICLKGWRHRHHRHEGGAACGYRDQA